MEIINLNLIPGKAWPVAHATQFDKGREFRANLFEGSQVYTLAGDETVDAIIKKPDGNQVIEPLVNTADNYVIVTTTEQMTAVAGPSLGEIRITKGDTVIGSLKFILECEQSADTGIESHSEINNLEAQVDGMVADALATQYDSANVVFDNLPTAGHGTPYTVTSEGIGNAIDNALDMTDTASGAIATFDTSLALPLQDCTIAINAVQESGTPTPQDSKAISGFTGANIAVYNENLFTSMATSTADGITTSYDSTTGYISITNDSRSTNFSTGSTREHVATGLNSSHTYKYEIYPNVTGVILFGGGMTVLSKDGFTGYTTVDLRITKDYDFVNDHPIGSLTKVRLVIYDVTTGVLNTYPISWNDEAGTVYGGSLDVTSGKFTVDYSDKLDLGDLSWGYNSNYGGIFYAQTSASHTKGQAIVCDCYQTTTISIDAPNTDWNSVPDLTIGLHYQGGINYIYVKNSNYTDAVAFTSAMAGHKYITAIATPVTYQLTPTQISAIVGTNNIFTDTNGDTSLEYYTKRGEQTVHIAEGVAVDVINNKNIDNLTTNNKTLVGAVNEVVKTNTISVSKGSAVNTATISCYQVGKLVQLYIVGDANTTWGGSSEIATGLPIPENTNIRYGLHKTSAGSPYGMGTTYQCSIDSNGKLVPMYIPSGAIGNGDYFFISFCYIAKDLQ